MRKLAERPQCTGCSACAAVCPQNAIRMEADEFGFFRPIIRDDLCISCGKCGSVCPVGSETPSDEITEFYAAVCKNRDTLQESTSGGVFGLLAQWVLTQGGAVYGAAYDDKFRVRHIRITNLESLSLLRGAKYAQSDLGNAFRQVREDLKRGKIVLFSGTPCQIAGLNNYIGTNHKGLITSDLVCHSVPSPDVWSQYLEYRQGKDGQSQKPVTVQQRSKKTGWVNYSYASRVVYPDGTESLIPAEEDLYMRAFIGGTITNSACATCPIKGTERSCDFTLGDFWGIEKLGLDIDVALGVSAVMVHTEKGRALWRALADQMISIPVTREQVLFQNPAINKSASLSPYRETVLQDICQNGFDTLSQLTEKKDNESTMEELHRSCSLAKRLLHFLHKNRE